MTAFRILIRKEYGQMIRDAKVVWLPLVFIFLGATQPVVTYYLPSILASLGGGQGITIAPEMIQQKGGDVLAATLGSQFDQLGLMIIALSMMGVVQADKANGMLAFMLTRPVTVWSYIAGKIVSSYMIVAASVSLGYGISAVYTSYLFTNVPVKHVIGGLLLYLVWILFIVTFTAMVSTFVNGQGIIALLSICFLLFCRMTTGLHPYADRVNPAGMSRHAMNILMGGSFHLEVFINLLITFVWILWMMAAAHYWIEQKKYLVE